MIINIPGASERRQTPRYEISLPVDMVLSNNKVLSVNTRNISSSGLQIVCDTWITDEIDPRGLQSHTISHIRLKAVTELPIGDETKKLYANCKMMSVRRLSQDEYMLNIAFIDFENGTENVLDEFLDQYHQKKTVIDLYG
ncbi:MAG: hypothetical protein GQ549_02345 [Gammaproteobacteria bacterium]|nr:hypothetical protein [Gammaproteobacteria bacterium]